MTDLERATVLAASAAEAIGNETRTGTLNLRLAVARLRLAVELVSFQIDTRTIRPQRPFVGEWDLL